MDMEIVDVNGDGGLDISTIDHWSTTVSILENKMEVVGISEDVPGLAPRIAGVWPNPVHNTLTTVYELPRETSVQLAVYDIQGRLVVTLDEGTKKKGRHEFMWNTNTAKLPSGIYFLCLQAWGQNATWKFVKVR